MSQTWTNVRGQFAYEYDLRAYDSEDGLKTRIDYKEKHKDIGLDVSSHKGYFRLHGNDLGANAALETHFQVHAQKSLEAYYEIMFWKEPMIFRAARMIYNMMEKNTPPAEIFKAGEAFVEGLDQKSFKHFTELCGIKGTGLAVPSAILCFINPDKMPIVDMWVARWVNAHHQEYEGLMPFDDFNNQCLRKQEVMRENAEMAEQERQTVPYPIVRANDFESYRKWILWTREYAKVLTSHTKTKWRARDVEMAVFTAHQANMELHVL